MNRAGRRRVLVVSHEASRTGAPRVAVEVLRALGQPSNVRIAVLRWGGPLSEQFRRTAEKVVLEPLRWPRVIFRRWRPLRPLATRVEQVAAGIVLRRMKPSVVYLNTVKAACYVRPAVALRLPVVLHVHEVEPLASETLARYGLSHLFHRITLVAASEAGRRNLARITGIPADRIGLIPSAIDGARVVAQAGEGARPGERKLPLVVGACGAANFGKGVDQWLEVAARLQAAMGEDVRFVWVGASLTKDIRQTMARLRLNGKVTFVGPTSNPYRDMARFDVFTLPSRGESYPLVVLEAMTLGRPVVAFDVGGVRDQVGECGRLVESGDTSGMATAVRELLEDPAMRRDLGERARERARARFGIGPFQDAVRRLIEERG